jgi:hypothetical protein
MGMLTSMIGIEGNAFFTVTATADGLTTGIIPNPNYPYLPMTVDVVCAAAARLITLPAPVPGTHVRLLVNDTAEAFRIVSSNRATVELNDVADSDVYVDGTPGASHIDCYCCTPTNWTIVGMDGTSALFLIAAENPA